MRLVSWGERDQERPGLLIGEEILDLHEVDSSLPDTFRALYAQWGEYVETIRVVYERAARVPARARRRVAHVRVGAPSPDPGEIVCLAGNYEEHVREGESLRDFKRLPHPKLFSKAGVTACGPYDDIPYPHGVTQLDYEVELAVILGRRCFRVSASEALDYVAGYCVLNDVSARCAQFTDQQFFRGKSFMNFCPMGPALVTPDEAGDIRDLAVFTWVNGEERQHARTSAMIHSVPAIIEFVSHIFPLRPGDVIATGTPAGVGVFRNPPALLKPGDVVEMEIERLGRLRNKVVCGL